MAPIYDMVIAKPPLSLTEASNVARIVGIKVVDVDRTCFTYADIFDQIEYRNIARAVWHPGLSRMLLELASDATRDDVAAALIGVAKLYNRGAPDLAPRWWEPEGQTLTVGMARRLSDYGQDLSLVVGLPQEVTVGTTNPALSGSV